MRYYFTKESDSDGIVLVKSIFIKEGKEFIKTHLLDSAEPISIENTDGKRFRVSLVNERIHVERIK